MYAMMQVGMQSFQILGFGLKCPVHRSSDFGLPSRLKKNIGLLAKKRISMNANINFGFFPWNLTIKASIFDLDE